MNTIIGGTQMPHGTVDGDSSACDGVESLDDLLVRLDSVVWVVD